MILDSWPGQMRTVFGDHERFVQTYFSTYKGMYFTGDGCRRDEDGYYWITGRIDDVINVSGHRMGTAEVESALVAHPKVAEAAVVGYAARPQGPGHLRLCHADDRHRADRGIAQGTGDLGPQGDRSDRLARPDPVLARSAQDPLGQDHAPHPAQDRDAGLEPERIVGHVAEADLRTATIRRGPFIAAAMPEAITNAQARVRGAR